MHEQAQPDGKDVGAAHGREWAGGEAMLKVTRHGEVLVSGRPTTRRCARSFGAFPAVMTPTSRFWLRGLRMPGVIVLAMIVLSLFPVEGELDTLGELVARGVVLLCINAFGWFCFQSARAWGRRIVDQGDVQRYPWYGRVLTGLAVWLAIGLTVGAVVLLLLNVSYLLQLALAFRQDP